MEQTQTEILEKEWLASKECVSDFEWVEEDPAVRDYLKGKMRRNLKKIKDMRDQIISALIRIKMNPVDEMTDWMRNEIVKVWLGEDYSNLLKETNYLKILVYPPPVVKKNQITPARIATAKNQPIENLIDVDKNGWSHCIWHEDKHRSMWCRNNWAYCFSCGASGDVIAVLMKLKNICFQDAVRILS